MANFVSETNASELMDAIGTKKLTVTDVMPTASEAYEGITYLYLGTTNANFVNGAVYKCVEVTPATNPKTYEWVQKIAFNTAVDNAFSDQSTNALQNKVITEKFADEDAEIADIVNVYGSKNLIPYPYQDTTITRSGVTFTDNGDGTVTANTGTGTATAQTYFYCTTTFKNFVIGGKYIINCKELGGSSSTYRLVVEFKNSSGTVLSNAVSEGDDTLITIPENTDRIAIILRVYSGASLNNVVFKPMMRLASIENDAYEPYAPTNRQLLSQKDNGILGAKNSLWWDIENIKAENTTGTWNGNTYTINDSTLTFAEDGVTINGTFSADTEIRVFYRLGTKRFRLPNGTFKLLTQLSTDTQKVSVTLGCTRNNAFYTYASLRGSGKAVFTVSESDGDSGFSFTCLKDYSFSNLKASFMVLIPSDNDTTYQPYADTNKGLTDRVAALEARLDSLNAITYGG